MTTRTWQGSTELEGNCPAIDPDGGWAACTLDADHRGEHEAWGTEGLDPIRTWPLHIGDTRACPDCGRPQHYTGTELGWCHDAAFATLACGASPALLAEMEK